MAAADYEPGPDESVGAKLLRAQLSAERAEAAVAQAAAVRAAEAAATERVRAQCAEELERALEAARAEAAVAQAKAVRAAEERCAGERVAAVQTAVEEVAHDFAIEPELVAHSRMNTSVASAFEAAAASAAAAAAAARLRDGEGAAAEGETHRRQGALLLLTKVAHGTRRPVAAGGGTSVVCASKSLTN